MQHLLDRSVEVDGCRVMTLRHNGHGYVQVKVGGKKVLAHRLMYEHHHGPIPEGMVIDHQCGNRACVEIRHLEAVTPAVNRQRATPLEPTPVCRNGHLRSEAGTNDRGGCRECGRDAVRRYRARALVGN